MKAFHVSPARPGMRVSDALSAAGIKASYSAPCGGHGRCGKCRVRLEGALSAPDGVETKFLSPAELEAGLRLACRCCAEGEFTYFDESADDSSAIQLEGAMSGFELSPVCGAQYGVAVDIGTTTAAVYLCSLFNGTVEASAAFQNPQRKWGADVISRIGACIDDYSNLDRLRSAILDGINGAIDSFSVSPEKIGAAAITGNTTMLHFAAGLDPRGIANAPFTPSSLFGDEFNADIKNAAQSGLLIAEGATVYYMPCFSAYVGGDIASGMAAADFDIADGVNLYVDIGTNGEMALGGRDGILLCSTAAGPAFEGAHIECGMGGVAGAIRRVTEENGVLQTDVIGGRIPTGICGSGLIDAVAMMLYHGALGETGRLDGEKCEFHNRAFGHSGEQKRFYLTNEVYISDSDIREVQLAKAAIRAGISTMLDESGADEGSVSRLYLAGGFGSHIDPRSACAIGMLPPALLNKISAVGNTAGTGAALYLMSRQTRERIASMRDKARYLELSRNEFFMDEYIEQMCFEI